MKRTRVGFVLSLLLLLFACTTQPTIIKKKNPQAAIFNTQLGVAYLQRNRLVLANEKLRKALIQAPNYAPAHHFYALLQYRLGDIKTTKLHFKQALQLDNEIPELHNNYGSFLCDQKQYQQAEKEFLLASKNPLYPTPEFAYTNAGICMVEAGDNEKALYYFNQALNINPTFSAALNVMKNLEYINNNK